MSDMLPEKTDPTVTVMDVRAAGFCIIPGLKSFLEDRGHSLKDFVREGLPASVLLSYDDARADRAVAKARERLSRG